MRSRREKMFDLLRSGAAIALALIIAVLLILFISKVPGESVYSLLIKPFTNLRYIWQIFERMIPILFTGLAVCVMFSANQFNLASEGAFYAGGLVTAVIAIYVKLPPIIHPIVAVLCGAAAAALLMLIPSVLSVKLGASVMVTSLMMNYVLWYVCLHVLSNVIRDIRWGGNGSLLFETSARIPALAGNMSWGIVAGLVITILCGLFMYRTRWGYSIRMIGANNAFARYSGLKVGGIIILSQVIGGLLAGMGGAIELLGYYDRFKWNQLPGYGWTGVTIAILAKNNPLKVPLAAFFLAYLEVGCGLMQTYGDMQPEMLDIIKAVIFLFFAAENFLAPLRQKLVVKDALEKETHVVDEKGAKA